MMATHAFDTFNDNGTPTAATVIVGGRSAATFVVVARVSLAFISGGRTAVHGRHRTAGAAGVAVRAVLVGMIGLALGFTQLDRLNVILPWRGALADTGACSGPAAASGGRRGQHDPHPLLRARARALDRCPAGRPDAALRLDGCGRNSPSPCCGGAGAGQGPLERLLAVAPGVHAGRSRAARGPGGESGCSSMNPNRGNRMVSCRVVGRATSSCQQLAPRRWGLVGCRGPQAAPLAPGFMGEAIRLLRECIPPTPWIADTLDWGRDDVVSSWLITAGFDVVSDTPPTTTLGIPLVAVDDGLLRRPLSAAPRH